MWSLKLFHVFVAAIGLAGTSTSTPASSDAQLAGANQVYGLGIPVTDMKKSLEFWTKTLGIGLQQQIPTINAILYQETILSIAPASTKDTAGANIILMQYPNTTIKHGAASGKAVFFVNDVPKMVSSLKEKGVQPFLNLGVVTMFKDPDGFVIELMPK
jgi:hypothetical protein